MKYIYLCSREIAKQFGFIGKKKENHSHHTSNNITYFWPNKTNNRTTNPISINRIKEDHKIKDIVILDRVRGTRAQTTAIDHINKTGENFLIGNTPHGGLPRFPDASNVYKEKNGNVFESYGRKFNKAPPTKNKSRIISEWLAPVALVWSYVGATTTGRGIPDNIKYYRVG